MKLNVPTVCCLYMVFFLLSPPPPPPASKFTRREQVARPVWGIWARWLSLMEDDNDGFKKWPPLLSPGQNPSACIFRSVWPLLKDPWAKCCIFINQLSLMGWKELWKEQRGNPSESLSNSFPGEPQGFFFSPTLISREDIWWFPGISSG